MRDSRAISGHGGAVVVDVVCHLAEWASSDKAKRVEIRVRARGGGSVGDGRPEVRPGQGRDGGEGVK